jgi:hypothetical protein
MTVKPLQLWLPRLGGGIGNPEIARDAARAFQLRAGEPVLWMLPELGHPVRWQVAGVRHLAMPAEAFERIDIVHVTAEGLVYAPTAPDIVLGDLDSLLDAWLNVRGPDLYIARPVTVTVPHIEPDGTIAMIQRKLTFGPGAYMPFSAIDPHSRTVTMRWPPEGSPRPVSPEAESAKRFPSRMVEADPPVAVTENGERAPQLFLRWPQPFEPMMPVLSGPDELLAQAQMAEIARRSRSDPEGALRAATVAARPYVFHGHARREEAWLYPTLRTKGFEHVLFKAEDFGLPVPPRSSWTAIGFEQALQQEEWRRWRAQTVPVCRVWGLIGLCWALLLDRLEQRRPFSGCERCGRVIASRRRKRFCGRSENRQCFNGRRAGDKRRSRLREDGPDREWKGGDSA